MVIIIKEAASVPVRLLPPKQGIVSADAFSP